MKFTNAVSPNGRQLAFGQLRLPMDWPRQILRLGLFLAASVGMGLAVIISTYYVENAKLLVGLVGGLAFILVTLRWPELSILFYVALLSGLVSLGSLPALRLGPVSLLISDLVLVVLFVLVCLRATTQPGFKLIGSPLILPLLLFIGAFLLSGANAVVLQGISANTVFRIVRVLIQWIGLILTLQLVRDEQALKRLLLGLLIFSGLLLFGVVFPNMISPLLYIEESATGVNFSRFYYAGDMVLYAMIPVTLASLAMLKQGSQAWRFGLLALLLYWVFRTYFRQYWLTLFVISMLLVVFLSGKERMRLLKRSLPAAIAGVVILSVLMTVQPAQFARAIQPLTSRLASLGQDPLREGSLQWRVIETNYALEQIVRHPVFGIGLGKPYRPPMITESGTNTYTGWASTYIENGYLYILVTMGLVGLLPFLWLCGVYLFRVFRHQHEIQDDGLRAIYIGFGLAFLGMMACNITTPTFVIGSRSIFFPVSMAINEIILRLEREKRARP